MTQNNFNLACPVKKFKHSRPNMDGKPAVFGSLWMILQLDPINVQVGGDQFIVQDNSIRVDTYLSFDTKDGKPTLEATSTKRLIDTLQEGCFVHISSGKVAKMKRAKKVGDVWEDYHETGFRTGNSRDLTVYKFSVTHRNTGTVSGKVIKQVGNQVIIEDRYRNPKTDTYDTREVPIILPDDVCKEYLNKYICVYGSLCGKNPKGESKTFVVAKDIYQI
jgi:hypothetical protein